MMLLPVILAAALSQAKAPDLLYEETAPAVVGIECWTGASTREMSFAFGTGVIIDPAGLVLTSLTVVPPEAKRIRAQLRGGRFVDAERMRSVPEMEMVILRLQPAESAPRPPYPFLRLGRSAGVRVGQLAYALGNAFRSIIEDDQVSFAAGAISGKYILTEARADSKYLGPALETTAAVNDGMDGGPLIDARGRVVGLLSLNFSRTRWLGTAIPIDDLKPLLAEDLGWVGDRLARSPGYLGIELGPAAVVRGSPGAVHITGAARGGDGDDSWKDRAPVVAWVDADGPAGRAGLREGDRISGWNEVIITDSRQLRPIFEELRLPATLKLSVERGRERIEMELKAWGRF